MKITVQPGQQHYHVDSFCWENKLIKLHHKFLAYSIQHPSQHDQEHHPVFLAQHSLHLVLSVQEEERVPRMDEAKLGRTEQWLGLAGVEILKPLFYPLV